jgi:ATP-dependent DNA helicase RecG
MSVPDTAEVSRLLDQLEHRIADDLESEVLDFKPWQGPKDDLKLACEYAACFANAGGGVVVFGVADKVRGRAQAIHGARGYDLDVFRRGIFDGTRPGVAAEVVELNVPEGTGKLLVVRVNEGDSKPYGTAAGLFKQRVGKNCMPLDPVTFQRAQVRSAAVDWSGAPAHGLSLQDLDPLQIERARQVLRSKAPSSGLLELPDPAFLSGLEALREGQVTHAGMLLFARREVLAQRCPQAQFHYVLHDGETSVARNDIDRLPLLEAVERMEQVFTGPLNPEKEIELGLFKLRIPQFPVEGVREAVLNALTHRDYLNPGEILVRHSTQELVVTSPGGFVAGITPENILRHEAVPRNRTLANALVKLRLVESSGIGRRRIFRSALVFGKRRPEYVDRWPLGDAAHVQPRGARRAGQVDRAAGRAGRRGGAGPVAGARCAAGAGLHRCRAGGQRAAAVQGRISPHSGGHVPATPGPAGAQGAHRSRDLSPGQGRGQGTQGQGCVHPNPGAEPDSVCRDGARVPA